MSASPRCHYCGSDTAELRPYGPGGSFTCHPCMTATPEREEAAKAVFIALVEANTAISPTGAIVLGEQSGPRPFDPREVGEASNG